MELSSDITAGLVLLITLSFFLYHYLFSNLKVSKNNAPPEAGDVALNRPSPPHDRWLLRQASLHITLAAMADKYGPIFTVRLGVHRAVVIRSSELAKEIFTKYDAIVSSCLLLLAPKSLGSEEAMFGFIPYGSYWSEPRKLISSELLSSRRLELQMHVFESEIKQSIKELYNLWEEKKGASGHVMVEMKEWFGDSNLNVVLRMVVGKRYFGSGGSGAEEARRCRAVIRDFFGLADLFVVGDAVPFLGWLDIGGYEKKMKETSKELDSLVGQWLEEHRQ